MIATFKYAHCPVCQSPSIGYKLSVVDHTVSGQSFEIWECADCSARFTQQVPDVSSIGRYYQSDNYISHSDTSKGFVNSLYHLARKITLRQKRRLLQNFTGLTTGALLDIGAGTGAFASFMERAGWKVTALEPDETARKMARDTHSITLLPSDKLFHLPPGSFDAITMWHVLEHVHSLHEYMKQLKTLLKPGGRLFIAVPNYTSYDAQMYKADWAAYDVPRHLYHFSPRSMRKLLENHNLALVSVRPMWFDSFYVSLLSEKYKTGKGNLVKGAWAGFVSNFKTLFQKERCSSLIYVIRH
jgi:SAM-dependent methyltransferase